MVLSVGGKLPGQETCWEGAPAPQKGWNRKLEAMASLGSPLPEIGEGGHSASRLRRGGEEGVCELLAQLAMPPPPLTPKGPAHTPSVQHTLPDPEEKWGQESRVWGRLL